MTRDRPPAPAPEPLPAPVVDAHTHLDACGAADEAGVRAVMDAAEAVGVSRVVTVADDMTAARWVVAASTWDPRVSAAVALHPTRTSRFGEEEQSELERLASRQHVVAVGETGLDYYWDYAPPEAQQLAYRWHIDLAKRLRKPLMIHDREAHDDVLSILDDEGPPETVIFHCFSGDVAMARRCIDSGYVLSFAGSVTFRNARPLREAAALVPDEHLLVETDAPFLTPHPHRGKANEPRCLPYTVYDLALLRGQDVEHVVTVTRLNAERLLGLRAV